jgi:hypothetical protein
MGIKKVMKYKSKPKLFIWLVILASVTLAVTLIVTSLKIIRVDKSFTQVIHEENKAFVVNTVRFGHGVMAHMGVETYDSLIDLALKSKLIAFLGILDEKGNVIAQSELPSGLHLFETYDVRKLKDGTILEKTKNLHLSKALRLCVPLPCTQRGAGSSSLRPQQHHHFIIRYSLFDIRYSLPSAAFA